MHRFYLPPEQGNDLSLRLEAREAHHGLQVLRLRPSEKVVVLDGAGHEYLCEVGQAERRTIHLTVRHKNTVPRLPYEITLVQGLPKGKLFESIIQKATELGVTRIVPLLSERVSAHWEPEAAENKVEKWRLTAVEAIKQCGSAWLPVIERPVRPRDYLARLETFDLPLIASLQPASQHPRVYFRRFAAERHHRPRSLCLWVGPEGDFTPAELNAAQSAGALPITLGKLVLRCETAAVYGLSILNYELQSPDPLPA